MSSSRLLLLTGLAVTGALCAGTAASVYTASLPRHDLHSAVTNAPPWLTESAAAWAAGANPRSAALQQQAADRRVPYATRLRAAHVLVVGACLNAREVLFGARAQRDRTLDSIAARLADLRQAPTAVAAARTMLQAFDEGTPLWSDLPDDGGERAGPVVLSWLVPDRVVRRVRLCRTLLRE